MFLSRFLKLLFLLLAAGPGFTQGFLKADGTQISNDKVEIILKGMGLGGWMLQEPYMLHLDGAVSTQHELKQKITALVGKVNTEKFYDAWLANHCTKSDIDSLAKWGFNAVRLPMHYNLYTLPVEDEKNGQNTWLQKGFDLTDSLLSWCKANHIYLILDLHAAPGGQGTDNSISDRDPSKPSLWQNEANKQKTIALWEKLASRYVNEPWIGGYDILNEPNWGFQDSTDEHGCAESMNAPLKLLYQDITKAIRKIDNKHIIFIEGNCWGNNYKGIFPLWDKNIVISFHKYWNFNNKASIQTYLDYREKYRVPIWLGETGENSNSWFTDVVSLMEENKIGWTMWPLKKAGLNNPLQIKINPGFQQIIDFWNNQASKPNSDTAFASLMELAGNTKIEKNNFQAAVPDAMMRQVHSNQAIPYKQNVIRPGAILFASDYDYGKSGVAYHDTDSADYWVATTKRTKWNEGGEYRNDGVDIEKCNDTLTNGYHIGWIADGEWLQYSLYSNADAHYDVIIRTSATSANGKLSLLINDHAAGKTVAIPATGNNEKWQSLTITNFNLLKGWNKLRVLAVSGDFNLNYLQFTSPVKM